MKINKVIISGGGTGGHIFPALSIAAEIKRRNPQADILFVGALGRMEMERVPAAGYKIVGLPVAGFDRKRLWRNFSVLVKLYKSMRTARRLVREFKPDLAIGVGGYASGPTLKAAQNAGIPTLIQEQNSFPGVTNKMLAARAGAICVAYPGTERFFPAERITLTGNPVRAELLDITATQAQAKQAMGFDPSKPLVLVVGGSLGARTVNEAVGAGLDALTASGAQVMWQTGRYGEQEAAKTAARFAPQVKASAFIADMATAYRAADLVISRAGAGSISELQLLGKPVVLVPSPNVAEDHQRKNAEALAQRGAAVMILDADANRDLIPTAIELLSDSHKLQQLSQNILTMALPQAAQKIVQIAESMI